MDRNQKVICCGKNFEKKTKVKADKVLAKKHFNKILIILVSLVLLVYFSLFSIGLGSIKFSLMDILDCIRGQSENPLAQQIIYNIRIPRILTSILVGMNLAVAGLMLQGILKNPMASPNIIGVNSGAGLVAVIIMSIFPSKIEYVPMAAFSGALITSIFIYILSIFSMNKGTTLILAGVAINSLFSSITSGIMLINSDELLISYTWLAGSFSGRSWTYFYMILPYSIIGLSIALFLSPKLNLFSLGDEMAKSLGISVKKYKIIVIIIASTLAGSAVSVAGTIGFIGLIAPHIARLLVGYDHRYLLPLSIFLGALLTLLSDTIARTIFSPFELPVGIIISILGAPFFLSLLYKKKGF